MEQRYTIQGSTLQGIADAIREKLGITGGIDGARFAEYVAAFPTRERLDVQRDRHGVTLLMQEGLGTLIPPDGQFFTEISWRVLVDGQQVYSDGEMGYCGSHTTFDLLQRYAPHGGETVVIRVLYALCNMATSPPTWTDDSIESAPLTLGWTLHPINNQTLTVTENGTYTPSAGYTGFDSVTVNVAGGSQGGEEEEEERKYLFRDAYIEPFTSGNADADLYTIYSGVDAFSAGSVFYVERDGQPYGSFTLSAQMLEEMSSGFCDVEVLPKLHYGVDFDAKGTGGWFWMGESGVRLSMYYIMQESGSGSGGVSGACMHSAGGYTVFLDNSGTVHVSCEENYIGTSWTVEVVDADSGAVIERGTAAMGDLRYITALNASGHRAYALVDVASNLMQTNTAYFP